MIIIPIIMVIIMIISPSCRRRCHRRERPWPRRGHSPGRASWTRAAWEGGENPASSTAHSAPPARPPCETGTENPLAKETAPV
jgi:hypothetical protein